MPYSFSFESPPGIYFGIGQRTRLEELLLPLGHRILVLTGNSWLKSSGWQKRFEKILRRFSLEFYPCGSTEPTVDSVDEARRNIAVYAPDVLVAVGGGSVLDTAKALSALLPLEESPAEYLEGVGQGKKLSGPGIPWVAVPTTAGTGAEVTKNSVIRATTVGAKKSLRSPFLIARCAVIDPELMLDLPPRITGISGLDALTQLIEAYVSRRSQPMTKALVRDALPGMLSALEVLASSPKDLEARGGAAYGSLVSGLALANSGLGAAHGFASGIGGLYEIPHGLICAVTLPAVLECNAPAIEAEIALLLRLGGIYDGQDPIGWLSGVAGGLLDAYGLGRNLTSYGIDKKQIADIAERSTGSSMSGNPVALSQKDKVRILQGVL